MGWSIFYDHFKGVSQENKQSLFSGAPQNCKTILKGVIKYANIAMISYIFIVIKIYSINIKHKLRLKSI
jgi:hypothetical protein